MYDVCVLCIQLSELFLGNYETKRAGVSAMLTSRIREVLGSNSIETSDIVTEGFRAFPQFFQASAVMVYHLGLNSLPPNLFKTAHLSFIYSTLFSLGTDIVFKSPTNKIF